MDIEAFVRWALDDARTVEERYTTELLVEQGVSWWNSRHKIYKHESFEERIERKRQRALNPAYQPQYSEESVRKSAEVFHEFKSWSHFFGYDERPIRDLKVFRFLPNLEDLGLNHIEVADISILAEFTQLRKLVLASRSCEDFSPLAHCTGLRELVLQFGGQYFKQKTEWPELTGLERLDQLETLSLDGNLLAFKHGIAWPKVRRGTLKCQPLDARSVRELPQLPACEFLTLAGVERLDGIEAFPRLRNLTIETVVRDFAPLEALRELTCFACEEFEPVDISPLVRVPKLHFISFDSKFKTRLIPVKPRDFSTLIDAPNLRELHVNGCPPVMTEVAALNAGLPSWGDLLLRTESQVLPPLRLILAPFQKMPRRNEPHRAPGEPELIDKGMRECEGRWVGRLLTRAINKKIGCADWGKAEAGGEYRSMTITIESFGAVEKLPQILDAGREVIARLRENYTGHIHIFLKAPTVIPTPAQIEMEKKFQDEQDNADFERGRREREEYLERLHRFELKKQDGQKIKPEEFAPGEQTPLPPPPWEGNEEEDDSDDQNSSDIAVKKKPDPPPSWLDDEHPLADNYRTMGQFTLSEAWFPGRDDAEINLIKYLMGRAPDEIIPEDEKK